MKKILFLLFGVLLLTSCNSKPTFDTSLLIGKWVATETDYEDGIMSSTIVCYYFVNDKDFNIEAKFNIDGDYYGQLTGEGTYKVSGDKIIIDIPQSNMDFKLNRKFFDSSYEYEEAVKETEKEILEEFEPKSEHRVLSLLPNKMLLIEDGETIELDKFE